MFNDYGLRTTDKNRARKLRAQGVDIPNIARTLKCSPALVTGYFNTLDNGLTAVQPALFPMEDEFGPLQDTPAWKELTPQKKSAITRQRTAAAPVAAEG